MGLNFLSAEPGDSSAARIPFPGVQILVAVSISYFVNDSFYISSRNNIRVNYIKHDETMWNYVKLYVALYLIKIWVFKKQKFE